MLARLFDVENGKVVPSEHCYTLDWLKKIMDEFEEDEEYLKVYLYLFYMTYPNPDQNPFFHTPEIDKEELIMEDIKGEFSTENPRIQYALDRMRKMYETPISRAYNGIAAMLDKLAKYMQHTSITDGKDGNISQIRAVAKDFESIRQSFKGAYKDLQEEQESQVRGGRGMAYDQ